MPHSTEENFKTRVILTCSLATPKSFILKRLVSMPRYQFFSTRLILMKSAYRLRYTRFQYTFFTIFNNIHVYGLGNISQHVLIVFNFQLSSKWL